MGSLLMRKVRYNIAALLLVPCLAAILWGFPLADDCEVYGSLKIDGSPATVGVELVAVIGTDEVARTTVTQAGS